jgi:nicotinamidase-related amidase
MTATELPENATLILIDVQKGFDEPYWGERNNPGAERNIERLLLRWRASRRPVIHVRHDSVEPDSALRPDRPGNAIKDEAAPRPGEPVVCVSTTARMAGNLGFRTFVLSDGTVAHAMRSPGPNGRLIPAAEMHEVGLAELNREFATVLTTDELLALL